MTTAIYPLTMPKWGIEMTEGTINSWNVREGQRVEKGESLLEVETDKIVNTVEAPVSGVLRRIIAAEGETRAVGTLIGVFADPDVSDAAIDEFIASFKGAVVSFEPDEPAQAEPSRPAPAPSPAPEPAGAGEVAGGEVRISPIARRLAERLGVDLSKVKGTGRNGRISKEDVEEYAARMQARGADETGGTNAETRVRMTSMRATIARRLLESKQSIPHYRLTVDVNAERLLELKDRLSAGSGVKVSVNDLLVRACALALVQHPMVNARLEGEEIVQYRHADIAIAVATDNGLVTPIVRGADTKSAAEIARETAALAERARRGELTREEITGGSFTISNLGMYGVSRFDAIINPPQVAILAVGAIEERVGVRDGVPAVARMMTLTLSSDHRVVDGAVAAAFLADLKRLIESADPL